MPAWGPVFFGNAAYGSNYSAFVKSGGSEVWDSKVYSTTSYTGGVSVTARCNKLNNADIMVGLSVNPASTANVNNEYVNVNYGFFPTAPIPYTGLDIYESGVNVASVGAYTANTVLSITYDGTNIRYYKDGVVVRTVLNTALSSTPLYFIAAFYHADAAGAITNVAFSSLVAVTPTPTPSVTPTVTPSPIVSLNALNYTYSASNRNNYTGYVGGRILTNSTFSNFRLTAIGLPYLTANGASYSTTVYLLDATGNSLASSAITVVAGSQFAMSFANFNYTLAPSTTYHIMGATTSGGFYWIDIGGTPVTGYNAVNPSSIVPITSIIGAYTSTLGTIDGTYGTNLSYMGINLQGYTF